MDTLSMSLKPGELKMSSGHVRGFSPGQGWRAHEHGSLRILSLAAGLPHLSCLQSRVCCPASEFLSLDHKWAIKPSY